MLKLLELRALFVCLNTTKDFFEWNSLYYTVVRIKIKISCEQSVTATDFDMKILYKCYVFGFKIPNQDKGVALLTMFGTCRMKI